MSKKRQRERRKKPRPRQAASLEVRRTAVATQEAQQKLSEVIKEMARSILKDPDAIPSEPAAVAALMLAGATWNSANGDTVLLDQHRRLVEQIDWTGSKPWPELRSDDIDRLIAKLAEQKRKHYPADLRPIVAAEMSPEGGFRVHWTEPQKVVNAEFASASSETTSVKAKRGRPIARKLVKKMQK